MYKGFLFGMDLSYKYMHVIGNDSSLEVLEQYFSHMLEMLECREVRRGVALTEPDHKLKTFIQYIIT